MSTIELTRQAAPQRPISNGVVGMVLLVITEIMFFAGLISAYLVNRAGIIIWPPYDQPRLPVEVTAVNTGILILSGLFFFLMTRSYGRNSGRYQWWLALSILAGLLFVGIQGFEWWRLIGYGLTTTSSIYGAFFYSIIGMHALHVMFGMAFLLYLFWVLRQKPDLSRGKRTIHAVSIFWYFVILIWPVLYYLVYIY